MLVMSFCVSQGVSYEQAYDESYKRVFESQRALVRCDASGGVVVVVVRRWGGVQRAAQRERETERERQSDERQQGL